MAPPRFKDGKNNNLNEVFGYAYEDFQAEQTLFDSADIDADYTFTIGSYILSLFRHSQ